MTHIKITDSSNVKTSEIMAQLRAKFSVYSYCDDETLDKDFPAPKESTTRYFADTCEPDEATLGKPASEADKEMKGITLRERLLFELAYFDKHGTHPDIIGWTLCTGSRDAGGVVPYVFLYGAEVRVLWAYPGFSDPWGGLRSAVSLDTSSSTPSLDEAIKVCKANGLKVVRIKTIEEEL